MRTVIEVTEEEISQAIREWVEKRLEDQEAHGVAVFQKCRVHGGATETTAYVTVAPRKAEETP